MRTCGECTLCCKLPRIDELEKPSWTWCKHCVIGKGCGIYGNHPPVCKDFRCLWLDDLELPDEWRPDLVHLYVTGKRDDDCLKVVADDLGYGFPVIEHYQKQGHHMLVASHNSLIFLCGAGRDPPAKLTVDWVL
jgi:hypothetical protein